MQVSFEETEMTVLLRNGKYQKRPITTPVFRLPDGLEFNGRNVGPRLRARIVQAGKLKGSVR